MSKKKLLHAALRSDLNLFIRWSFSQVSPGDTYMPNWHIQAIAYHLSLVQQGVIKRLVITMPPRHLKSIATSIAFPAWLLGHDPTIQIICASYGQDLATKLSQDTRIIMGSRTYRDCFPTTRLSATRNTQSDFATTTGGYRYATSVGGSLTGLGGSILILDDLIKAEDGQSETKRQQVNDWLRQTLLTRLNDPLNDRVVLVMQRFHEEDPAGILLENPDYVHLNLPAIAEQHEEISIGPDVNHAREAGEALHPERMPLELLMKIKQDIGSYAFASQYQQQPAPAGGGIIKDTWWRYYDWPPNQRPGDRYIQSWDFAYTANEMSDYTVCMTFLLRDYRLYLVDIIREKLEVPTLYDLIPKHADRWAAEIVIMEATGAGGPMVDKLRYDAHKRGQPINRYLYHKPTESKADRLWKVAHFVEAGRVYVPNEAPWMPAFWKEFSSFPNGRYDDQVDCVSQLLEWFMHRVRIPSVF